MSIVLENTISRPMTTNGVKTRLITVAEYDRMIEFGVYTENDRIECDIDYHDERILGIQST